MASILQHLPDLSDASLPIPGVDCLDDMLLMNDDGDDFLKDIDNTLGTPLAAAPRVKHPLSQLTPKAIKKLEIPLIRPPPPLEVNRKPIEQQQIQPFRNENPVAPLQTHNSADQQPATKLGKLKLKPRGVAKESSRGRFEYPKEVTETFNGNSDIPSGVENQPPIPEISKKRPRRNLKDIEISKIPKAETKLPDPPTVIRRVSEPSPEPVISSVRNPIIAQEDPDLPRANIINNSIILGGAAERLAINSQPSMSPSRSEVPPPRAQQFENEPPVHFPERSTRDSGEHVDKPLTLSEITPRKVVTQAFEIAPARSVSPMRHQQKRPSAEAPQEQPRKKGKRDNNASGAAVLQSSLKTVNETACSSSLCSDQGERNTKVVQVRQAPRVPKGKSRDCGASSSLLGSRSSTRSTSRTRLESVSRKKNTRGLGTASMSNLNTKAVHVPLTKPVEFNFSLDARMEARRFGAGDNERAKSASLRKVHNNHLPIPDFKALHAAQEAASMLRKEQITPVLPVPIELRTNFRAIARQEFDEMIKEKSKEIERALERRKKELEAEEEKEVMEIRRRAVPKANEVPEWYRTAPKRK